MAPSFVEGVIDLRGSIIPIVDMRKRLGTPVAADGRAMKYIIVSIAGRIVGLVVDAVKEVIRVTRSQLRPAPALTLNENAPIVLGVCAHDGQLLVLLDLDQLLSHAERASLPASAAAGAGAGAGAGGSPGAHPGADPLSAGLPVVDATSPEDGE
jgi:purine-binding chemotaxis protein CheW